MIADICERLCAIERAAVNDLTAVPYFLYSQEDFPYVTHRAADSRLDTNSENVLVREIEIVARLVVAHLTEGALGEVEANWSALEAALFEAFWGAPMLTSAAYPQEPDYLYPTEVQISAARGFRVFETAGIPAKQVGTEWVITVPGFVLRA